MRYIRIVDEEPKTAQTVGIGFFALFYLTGGLINTLLMSTGDPVYEPFRYLLALVPGLAPNAMFYHAAGVLSDKSVGPRNDGLLWMEMFDNLIPSYQNADGEPFKLFWNLEMTLNFALLSFVTQTALAWWLWQLLPNSYGKWGNPCSCVSSMGRSRKEANKSVFDAARRSINLQNIADSSVMEEAKHCAEGSWGKRNVWKLSA